MRRHHALDPAHPLAADERRRPARESVAQARRERGRDQAKRQVAVAEHDLTATRSTARSTR